MKHTKLPFRVDGSNIRSDEGIIANIYDPNDPVRETKTCVGNTEFIVNACNSHYDLLEACKAIASSPMGKGLSVKLVFKLMDAIDKAEVQQ